MFKKEYQVCIVYESYCRAIFGVLNREAQVLMSFLPKDMTLLLTGS